MNRIHGIAVTAALAVCAIVGVPALARAQGTIEGHVKLTGTPAPNAAIRMGADPNCLQMHAGKRVTQDTVLKAADGGLANVFVYVNGSFPGAPAPTASAVIDQRGCVYNPRVLGARVGQTLEVKNSDATLHNIHSMTAKDNSFNTGQARAGMIFKYQLKSEEVMLHVKCDVHPWMSGYMGILPHPYFAVSDATGGYSIAGVPPGKYTVTVWHEAYGPVSQAVEVKAGGKATLDFAYTGNEKPKAAAGMRIEDLTLPPGATALELVPVAAP